jgi:hypothetical protein
MRDLVCRGNWRRAAALLGTVFVASAFSTENDSPYEQPRHLAAQALASQGEVRSRCLPALAMRDTTCSVKEFGRVGAVEGHEFYYARYDYHDVKPEPHDIPYPRVVIFENMSSGKLRPILISGDDPEFEYRTPAVLEAGGRIVLHVPAGESGTGNFNHELVYVWAQDGWHDADVTSWLRDLARRLPKGLAVWKGVYPDYVKMKAETPLWREKTDGNCCPTGGSAAIELQWQGARLAVRSVRIEKDRE